MASLSGRDRLDAGRLVMVPVMGLLLAFDVARLAHGGSVGTLGAALRWAGDGLTCAFYALIIWCYLRRGPAVAATRSVTARVAALVATWTPLLIPLVHGAAPGASQLLAADVLLVAGTGWSIGSLRFLGGGFSVIAQARKVVDRGPYRWVRHPLYTGEIVASLGLVAVANSLATVAVWLGFCGLQAYRALREEQVLLETLPTYRAYRSRTAAILPGVKRT